MCRMGRLTLTERKTCLQRLTKMGGGQSERTSDSTAPLDGCACQAGWMSWSICRPEISRTRTPRCAAHGSEHPTHRTMSVSPPRRRFAAASCSIAKPSSRAILWHPNEPPGLGATRHLDLHTQTDTNTERDVSLFDLLAAPGCVCGLPVSLSAADLRVWCACLSPCTSKLAEFGDRCGEGFLPLQGGRAAADVLSYTRRERGVCEMGECACAAVGGRRTETLTHTEFDEANPSQKKERKKKEVGRASAGHVRFPQKGHAH